jgi:hypothetical protein
MNRAPRQRSKTLSQWLLAFALGSAAMAAAAADSASTRLRLLGDGDWLAIESSDKANTPLVLAPLAQDDPATRVNGFALGRMPVRVMVAPIRRDAFEDLPAPCSSAVSGLAPLWSDCQNNLHSPVNAGGRVLLAVPRGEVSLSAASVSTDGGQWLPWTSGALSAPLIYTTAGRPAPLLSDSMSVSARWQVAPTWGLNWSTGLQRSSIANLDSSSQSMFGFGVSHGSLSGSLINRVVQPAPSVSGTVGFSTLDLGFEWRLPWSAELSFGARNLMARPLEPVPPGSPDSLRESVAPKTAYIHYRQEL